MRQPISLKITSRLVTVTVPVYPVQWGETQTETACQSTRPFYVSALFRPQRPPRVPMLQYNDRRENLIRTLIIIENIIVENNPGT